ncbi:MAG: hypothetical protein ACLFSZ_09630 [Puniceicoccaceae bacterium]
MKSAYELAMERLEKSDPSAGGKLSDQQKEKIEEISRKYRAKIAEREVFLQGRISVARAAGDRREVESLERELRDEKRRLEDDREAEKQGVREG